MDRDRSQERPQRTTQVRGTTFHDDDDDEHDLYSDPRLSDDPRRQRMQPVHGQGLLGTDPFQSRAPGLQRQPTYPPGGSGQFIPSTASGYANHPPSLRQSTFTPSQRQDQAPGPTVLPGIASFDNFGARPPIFPGLPPTAQEGRAVFPQTLGHQQASRDSAREQTSQNASHDRPSTHQSTATLANPRTHVSNQTLQAHSNKRPVAGSSYGIDAGATLKNMVNTTTAAMGQLHVTAGADGRQGAYSYGQPPLGQHSFGQPALSQPLRGRNPPVLPSPGHLTHAATSSSFVEEQPSQSRGPAKKVTKQARASQKSSEQTRSQSRSSGTGPSTTKRQRPNSEAVQSRQAAENEDRTRMVLDQAEAGPSGTLPAQFLAGQGRTETSSPLELRARGSLVESQRSFMTASSMMNDVQWFRQQTQPAASRVWEDPFEASDDVILENLHFPEGIKTKAKALLTRYRASHTDFDIWKSLVHPTTAQRKPMDSAAGRHLKRMPTVRASYLEWTQFVPRMFWTDCMAQLAYKAYCYFQHNSKVFKKDFANLENYESYREDYLDNLLGFRYRLDEDALIDLVIMILLCGGYSRKHSQPMLHQTRRWFRDRKLEQKQSSYSPQSPS